MSIFDHVFKHKPKAKATKPTTAKGAAATKKASPTKPAAAAPRPGSSSGKDSDLKGRDEATAQLERTFANLAAEKKGNSYDFRTGKSWEEDVANLDTSAVIVGGFPSSKGSKLGANNRLLNAAQAGPSNRSLPPSPALSGIGSPSLAVSGGSSAQERLKQIRFPIIHELAVEDMTRDDLFAKWNEGTEDEFNTALNKVAELDKGTGKWSLKKQYWKELDAFEYPYARDEDRQTAIDKAIKEYDKMRISPSRTAARASA
jgi:RNA polymerase II elongation factor ELL